MIIKTLKIRKENFGWLACDIKNCNVYEISEMTAYLIKLLNKKTKINDKNITPIIKNIKNKFNLNEQTTRNKINEIIEELKQMNWIKK